MSGIVGGINSRSGLVNLSSSTDGEVYTGTGAGLPVGFEAAAGGGAWTLLDTELAANSASITLTGMSSTYSCFAVVIGDHKADGGSGMDIKFGDSGGINATAGIYAEAGHKHDEVSAHTLEGYSAYANRINLANAPGQNAGQGGGGVLYIVCNGVDNAAGSNVWIMLTGQFVFHQYNGKLAVKECGGMMQEDPDSGGITQVQLLEPGQDMVAGRFSLYGISHT